MRALLVSDIHCSYKYLSSIFELVSKDKRIKSIIFAGDLIDSPEQVSFVDEFIWLLNQSNLQLLWVPGNADFGRAYHRLNAKYKSLEGRIVTIDKGISRQDNSKARDEGHDILRFTGVGGSPASWSGQYQGERSVDKKAITGTIFVSHVPPPGLRYLYRTEQEVPKKDISNLKLSDAPLVHICGHIHHTWGIGYLGSTKVVKLAAGQLGYCVIMDLETLQVEFMRLWK